MQDIGQLVDKTLGEWECLKSQVDREALADSVFMYAARKKSAKMYLLAFSLYALTAESGNPSETLLLKMDYCDKSARKYDLGR